MFAFSCNQQCVQRLLEDISQCPLVWHTDSLKSPYRLWFPCTWEPSAASTKETERLILGQWSDCSLNLLRFSCARVLVAALKGASEEESTTYFCLQSCSSYIHESLMAFLPPVQFCNYLVYLPLLSEGLGCCAALLRCCHCWGGGQHPSSACSVAQQQGRGNWPWPLHSSRWVTVWHNRLLGEVSFERTFRWPAWYSAYIWSGESWVDSVRILTCLPIISVLWVGDLGLLACFFQHVFLAVALFSSPLPWIFALAYTVLFLLRNVTGFFCSVLGHYFCSVKGW